MSISEVVMRKKGGISKTKLGAILVVLGPVLVIVGEMLQGYVGFIEGLQQLSPLVGGILAVTGIRDLFK